MHISNTSSDHVNSDGHRRSLTVTDNNINYCQFTLTKAVCAMVGDSLLAQFFLPLLHTWHAIVSDNMIVGDSRQLSELT